VTGVTTVTNKFMDMSGGGTIAQSGSQAIVLDGLISGSNKISMEGTSGSSAITLLNSNSFTGGIDFTAPTRTPVYATGNGNIVFAKYEGRGYGNHIIVNHGFGYRSLYGHLSSIEVYEGQKVKRGELIGYVGNTGTSTAPHLHYEVEKGAKKVNPINYFFNDISEADYEAIRDISARPTQSFD
jgi:murein DD-endopeptidase MepM/ murein hydrolase activator NlpD